MRANSNNLILASALILVVIVRFQGLGSGLPFQFVRGEPIGFTAARVRGLDIKSMRGRYPNFLPISIKIAEGVLSYLKLDKPILAAYGLSPREEKTSFFLSQIICRFYSALFGIMGIIAVFLFSKRYLSYTVGLIAAFLLCVHPLHFFYSHFDTPHITQSFFIILTAFAGYNALRRMSVVNFLALGLVSGLTASTLQNGLLTLPFFCWLFFYSQKGRAFSGKDWRLLFAALAAFGLCARMVGYSSASTGGDSLRFGFLTSPDMPAIVLNNAHEIFLREFGFKGFRFMGYILMRTSPVMLLFAVFGGVMILLDKKRLKSYLPLFVLYGLFIFAHGTYNMTTERYFTEPLPLMALLAAETVIFLKERIVQRFPMRRGWLAASVLVVFIAAPMCLRDAGINNFLKSKSTYTLLYEWMVDQRRSFEGKRVLFLTNVGMQNESLFFKAADIIFTHSNVFSGDRQGLLKAAAGQKIDYIITSESSCSLQLREGAFQLLPEFPGFAKMIKTFNPLRKAPVSAVPILEECRQLAYEERLYGVTLKQDYLCSAMFFSALSYNMHLYYRHAERPGPMLAVYRVTAEDND
ncbi:MAG: glycosyltransferase family 39 protein [Candidatus Omnitrophica bacterium]|nr:glycosyltransferase family 39 protein [Candidatus Omnitrophota bacterium]